MGAVRPLPSSRKRNRGEQWARTECRGGADECEEVGSDHNARVARVSFRKECALDDQKRLGLFLRGRDNHRPTLRRHAREYVAPAVAAFCTGVHMPWSALDAALQAMHVEVH